MRRAAARATPRRSPGRRARPATGRPDRPRTTWQGMLSSHSLAITSPSTALGQRRGPGDCGGQVDAAAARPPRPAGPATGRARAAAASSSPRPAPMSTTVSRPRGAEQPQQRLGRTAARRARRYGSASAGDSPPEEARRARRAPRPTPSSRAGPSVRRRHGRHPEWRRLVMAPGYGAPRRRPRCERRPRHRRFRAGSGGPYPRHARSANRPVPARGTGTKGDEFDDPDRGCGCRPCRRRPRRRAARSRATRSPRWPASPRRRRTRIETLLPGVRCDKPTAVRPLLRPAAADRARRHARQRRHHARRQRCAPRGPVRRAHLRPARPRRARSRPREAGAHVLAHAPGDDVHRHRRRPGRAPGCAFGVTADEDTAAPWPRPWSPTCGGTPVWVAGGAPHALPRRPRARRQPPGHAGDPGDGAAARQSGADRPGRDAAPAAHRRPRQRAVATATPR